MRTFEIPYYRDCEYVRFINGYNLVNILTFMFVI